MAEIYNWSYKSTQYFNGQKPKDNMRDSLAYLMDMAEVDALERAIRQGADSVRPVGIYYGAFGVEIPFLLDREPEGRYKPHPRVSPHFREAEREATRARLSAVLHDAMLKARVVDFFQGIPL